MINKIIAFGDSFVQGHGVDPNDAWIAELGRRFNIDVKNCGVSGGSNKLSIVKLFDNWQDVDENTLVIFAWTSPVRTTFFDPISNDWQNVQMGHYYADPDIRYRVEHYYANQYNDMEGYTEFYQQQLMLDGFLRSKNIQYCFINSFLDNAKGIGLPLDKRSFYKQLIDRSKYMLGADSIFNKVCLENKMVCKDGFHPSEQGHIWLAEHVAKWLIANNFDLPTSTQYNNV